ncbi:MAG TPA: alpha/beta hydrolase [Candidatus Angelobacter sp.]|nr:alpha/beta hydrolase [Candidatus Angelobacter sp.]
MNLLRASAFFLFVATPPVLTVPHASGVAHTEQVDLGYETFGVLGAAIPIIAVNGGPGLSHAYMVQNDIWERVGKNRLVVLYDQRGTGASKRTPAGASQSGLSQSMVSQTMDAQVADLDAVRQALGLTKFALLGDSYGGLVAMAYAAAHPEHVAKLILSDSPGPSWQSIVHLLPDVFPDIEEQNTQEEQKLGPATEAAARASLRNHFRMIFYSPEKRDAYMSHMGDLGYEPAVGEAVSKATENLDLAPKLAGFQFPTLVINGRYDMNVAPLTAWRLAHAIPGAKAVFFEQSGHLPSYEEPDKYIEVLEAFLNAH